MVCSTVSAAAFAGTVTKLGNYEITLSQPTVVSGVTLKAGDYKLSVGDASVTFTPSEGGKPGFAFAAEAGYLAPLPLGGIAA